MQQALNALILATATAALVVFMLWFYTSLSGPVGAGQAVAAIVDASAGRPQQAIATGLTLRLETARVLVEVLVDAGGGLVSRNNLTVPASVLVATGRGAGIGRGVFGEQGLLLVARPRGGATALVAGNFWVEQGNCSILVHVARIERVSRGGYTIEPGQGRLVLDGVYSITVEPSSSIYRRIPLGLPEPIEAEASVGITLQPYNYTITRSLRVDCTSSPLSIVVIVHNATIVFKRVETP